MPLKIVRRLKQELSWRRFNLPVRRADAQTEDVTRLSVNWATGFASTGSLLTASDDFHCTTH